MTIGHFGHRVKSRPQIAFLRFHWAGAAARRGALVQDFINTIKYDQYRESRERVSTTCGSGWVNLSDWVASPLTHPLSRVNSSLANLIQPGVTDVRGWLRAGPRPP